jgi:hopanoid-associated phosphorylase
VEANQDRPRFSLKVLSRRRIQMILVATGLRREARLLDGPQTFPVVSGANAGLLTERLAVAPLAQAVLSAGLAGALAPGLEPGACVIADSIVDGEAQLPTDRVWSDALAGRLSQARRSMIAGSDAMLVSARDKAALRARTGADVVDMESHVAARFARDRGLPFAAVRFISDAADQDLPPAVRVGMRPDGGMDVLAVIGALARAPRQLPALLRTGRDAERAFRALGGLRAILGERFALP